MRMRSVVSMLTLALAAVTFTGAAEIGLTSVQFPEGKKIEVPMFGTQRAPAAEIEVEIQHEDGQSLIEIEYKDLPPAVLFGGDFVSYVVWGVQTDGTAENLGGIANLEDKGTASYSTASRDFALMITAEPIVTVRNPGDVVVFFSGTPAAKNIVPTGFTFGGLSERDGLVVRDNESIAGMKYERDKDNPLALIQADKAIELLDRFDAKKYDAAAYGKATASLATAREEKGKKQLDAAQLVVEYAGQALTKTAQMVEAEQEAVAQAEEVAARQRLGAEATMLDGQLQATNERLELTEAKLVTAESKLREAETELAAMKERNTEMEAQYGSISSQLAGAQGSMATGAKTDRGYVVSLSGTAFPSGKSTLTTDAKYVLAKLSGMLLAVPETKLMVEGHTDSTGSDEINQTLSQERADAVKKFLGEMGVDAGKMTSAGFGPTKPIAPNDTAEGRAKNRRVEIVLGGV